MSDGTKIRSDKFIICRAPNADPAHANPQDLPSNATTGLYMPQGINYREMSADQRAQIIYTTIRDHITPEEAEETLNELFGKMATSSSLRGWLRITGVDDPRIPLGFKRKHEIQIFIQEDRNQETAAATYGLLEKAGWLEEIEIEDSDGCKTTPRYVENIKAYLLSSSTNPSSGKGSENIKFRTDYVQKNTVAVAIEQAYSTRGILGIELSRQMTHDVHVFHLIISKLSSELLKKDHKHRNQSNNIRILIRKFSNKIEKLCNIGVCRMAITEITSFSRSLQSYKKRLENGATKNQDSQVLSLLEKAINHCASLAETIEKQVASQVDQKITSDCCASFPDFFLIIQS